MEVVYEASFIAVFLLLPKSGNELVEGRSTQEWEITALMRTPLSSEATYSDSSQSSSSVTKPR